MATCIGAAWSKILEQPKYLDRQGVAITDEIMVFLSYWGHVSWLPRQSPYELRSSGQYRRIIDVSPSLRTNHWRLTRTRCRREGRNKERGAVRPTGKGSGRGGGGEGGDGCCGRLAISHSGVIYSR